jgi:hypothetical protein
MNLTFIDCADSLRSDVAYPFSGLDSKLATAYGNLISKVREWGIPVPSPLPKPEHSSFRLAFQGPTCWSRWPLAWPRWQGGVGV